MQMTKDNKVKEVAESLKDCACGCEDSDPSVLSFAEENNIVIVFGYADDCAELCGAVREEIPCYNGGSFWINRHGLISDTWKSGSHEVKAIWCGPSGASWEYETEIPHETFNVYDDDELYCIGIVFCLDDLPDTTS